MWQYASSPYSAAGWRENSEDRLVKLFKGNPGTGPFA